MKIKAYIKKLLWGNRVDSSTYIKHLRSLGMDIGERTKIYDVQSVLIDETRPFLIKIGNDVKITHGVTMLTHGYDGSVLAGIHDVVLGSGGEITVGNNVFIGANATILKGVQIGNNVVIGAGSLVNKNIPDDCVAAGNPCKVVMSIEEYYKKRQKQQAAEAFEIYRKYVGCYKKEPPQEVFKEFFFLFLPRNEPVPKIFEGQMHAHNRFEQTYEMFMQTSPVFNGYEEFLVVARSMMKTIDNV